MNENFDPKLPLVTKLEALKPDIRHKSSVEQISFDRDRCREWPFFKEFDCYLEEFLRRECPREDVSYAIWGGVAADVLLGILGLSRSHYSVHDVELFFIQKGQVSMPQSLSDSLNLRLRGDDRFLLEIGGIPTIRRVGAMSVLDFQKQRVLRKDGDLYLNGIVLAVDRVANVVSVSAPTGTIESITCSTPSLLVKDWSSLCSARTVSRRVFRNVSKGIRYEYAANISPSEGLRSSVSELVHFYCRNLQNEDFIEASNPDGLFRSDWRMGNRVLDVQEQMTWLWEGTLSETIKRLAGSEGCSALDPLGFERFFSRRLRMLLESPLILEVKNALLDAQWREVHPTSSTVDSFYVDFRKYQQPLVETLRARYSIERL